MNGAVERWVSPDGVLRVQAQRGLFLMHYRGPGTATHAVELARVWRTPLLGSPFVHATVIAPRGARDVPDDAFRKTAARLLRERSADVVASAAVIQAEGFLAAVARGVVAGINWWSDDAFTLYSDSESAVAALAAAAQRAGLQIDAATIATQLVELSRNAPM